MNKLHFLGCDASLKDAKIVLFGAPFDSTVSFRPGTRFAPNKIRLDSVGLETYSPYQDKDTRHQAIADIGDVDVYYGNAEKTLESIYETTKSIVSSNQVPVMIGGEHLVSLGAIKAVHEAYPDLRIIHFDAHTDYRDTFFEESLSHATVIRRVHDILGDKKIYSFGIRSGEKAEFTFAKTHQTMELFSADTLEDVLKDIKGHPVYITLDLDVLDPAFMPGTGTQEAGGLTTKELLRSLLLLEGQNIVGIDMVELAPDYDPTNASTAVATKLLRELLLIIKT